MGFLGPGCELFGGFGPFGGSPPFGPLVLGGLGGGSTGMLHRLI